MIERDITGMRLPRHVSVILDQRKVRGDYDAHQSIQRVTELAMWCACAGISILTIYEPTGTRLGDSLISGLLKKDVKKIQRMVQKSVAIYLHPKSPFKVGVSTPQSALLNHRTIDYQRGSLQTSSCAQSRYGDSCNKSRRQSSTNCGSSTYFGRHGTP
jgi:hypothetical protein